jgi:hypothetical protein
MDAVIVERETDQQTLEAEPRAEGLHDRNRCAAIDDERRLTPLLRERVRGCLEDWSRCVETDRGRSAFVGKGRDAILGQAFLNEAMQAVENLCRLLMGNEPEGELGRARVGMTVFLPGPV